jgi:hypothetical protein
MKTLTRQSDNVSIYLFNNSRSVTIAGDKITVAADATDAYKVDAFVIGDHNSGTVTLHSSVATPPSDSDGNVIWVGGNYTYNGSAWAAV